MSDKILTAKEAIELWREEVRTHFHKMANDEEYRKEFNGKDMALIDHRFIEFAKSHVTAALQAAAEDADLTDKSWQSFQEGGTLEIDKNTILNAYPLTNIK